MYRTVVVAGLLLLVTGCAGGSLGGLPSDAGYKTIASAKTVGVISAVGHKFALQKMGITVFGNELKEVPSGSWGLDEGVVSKVSALLGSRYSVRRIGYTGGDLDTEAQDVVRKIAGSQKHDLYVVVTRAVAPFSSSNQYVAGVGLIETGGAINPAVHLYAVIAVQVYDGRTFERLAWQRAPNQYGGSLGTVINAPHRQLDPSWWPSSPQAANNEKLKSAARALLADGIARTLPELMGLPAGRKKGGA